MYLKEWDNLPEKLKCEEIRHYYNLLYSKRKQLILKRIFDILLSSTLIILFLPLLLIISIFIKIDSRGPIIFSQTRITQYGKEFSILKFRTMIHDVTSKGTEITVKNDQRITKIGKNLRKLRLDEIPQLINILFGDMTFVGTRPEVKKYVEMYKDYMLATLLIPSGVTSETSLKFRNEEILLENSNNIDETYLNEILPKKMELNLDNIKNFGFLNDLKVILKTVLVIFTK